MTANPLPLKKMCGELAVPNSCDQSTFPDRTRALSFLQPDDPIVSTGADRTNS